MGRIELLHYFDDGGRIRLRAESGEDVSSRKHELNEFFQSFDLDYRRPLSETAGVGISATFAHENDHSVNTLGQEFRRDFSYEKWKLEPEFSWKPDEDSKLDISYLVTRKNYGERSGMVSIDWWRAGPRARYRRNLSEFVTIVVRYELLIQDYDDELAGTATGVELASNPEERHYFQDGSAELRWDVSDDLEARVRYEFSIKDDRFQDFESYEEQGMRLELRYQPTSWFSLRAGMAAAKRKYDNRPGGRPGQSLEYDRIGPFVLARLAVSTHASVFLGYEFDRRDSNRRVGNSFRDFNVSWTTLGVSVAY